MECPCWKLVVLSALARSPFDDTSSYFYCLVRYDALKLLRLIIFHKTKSLEG